jgi:hypothetical protein
MLWSRKSAIFLTISLFDMVKSNKGGNKMEVQELSDSIKRNDILRKARETVCMKCACNSWCDEINNTDPDCAKEIRKLRYMVSINLGFVGVR